MRIVMIKTRFVLNSQVLLAPRLRGRRERPGQDQVIEGGTSKNQVLSFDILKKSRYT
jgi:hypothetical protein